MYSSLNSISESKLSSLLRYSQAVLNPDPPSHSRNSFPHTQHKPTRKQAEPKPKWNLKKNSPNQRIHNKDSPLGCSTTTQTLQLCTDLAFNTLNTLNTLN
ncbi:hypothetical protein M758_5G131600 [Ceratodon purpureus]|nr:hypothetical protein M758_5G131600 [Ceratodon purpureus]